MNWQHKPHSSPDLTREELERIVSLCGSDPSLESIRIKAEESLSVYKEWDHLLEQARIREEERRKARQEAEDKWQEYLWKEGVWTLFDPSVMEKLKA